MSEIVLKFSEPLPGMILRGEKDITWRVTDYNVQVGDTLVLCHNDGREFGRAKALWVKKTTFGSFTAEDTQGHEQFSSEEDMYKTYSTYYRKKITSETEVFVIKFELLNKLHSS